MGVIGPSLRHQRIANSNYVVTPSGGRYKKDNTGEKMIKGNYLISKKGENMNYGWVKANLLDGFGKFNFIDNYGLVRETRLYVYPINKDGKIIQNSYIKVGNEQYASTGTTADLMEKNLFIRGQYNSRTGRYDYEKIDIIAYRIKISFYDDLNQRKEIEFDIKNNKELENFTFYKTNEGVFVNRKPKYFDIKKGDAYYYKGKGVCTVTNLYEGDEYGFCEIKTKQEEKISVNWNDSNLFYVPYEQPLNEEEMLKNDDYSQKLQLYAIKQGTLINVMWQPIDEAANYTVKVYKYVNNMLECCNSLYFLKDYFVNRNEHFLAIDDLIGDRYYLVVIAEDREGKEITKSLIVV